MDDVGEHGNEVEGDFHKDNRNHILLHNSIC